MASTAHGEALAGLRSICTTDSSFEERLFLAHARRLFLRFHRAQAVGESEDIRPYLAKQLRRDFDAAVAGGRRISPVASIRSAKIVEASDAEDAGERIVVRFVALDAEQGTGVLGEDWTFERSTAMARWTAGERDECPTCGGPRVRGSEVCGYCGIPLAAGGWVVSGREQLTVSSTTTNGISRDTLIAVIAGSALVLAIAVLAIVLLGTDDEPVTAPAATPAAPTTSSTRPAETGVAGLAGLTLSGAVSGIRSGDAVSIGGQGSCDSVGRFAGFTATALPGPSAPGTITFGVTLPGTASGTGVYDGRDEPAVTIAYQRTDADGTTVTQSWDDGGTGTATLEIAEDGSMVVVFTEYTPKTSSADPLLNANLGGTVTFMCTG